MLWVCALGSLVLVAAYVLCWLYSGNRKIAFAGAMGVWFFGTISLVIRPHLIGNLLLICEMLILQLARTRDSRSYYALPPLFALWINFHSSFIRKTSLRVEEFLLIAVGFLLAAQHGRMLVLFGIPAMPIL